MEDQGQSDRAQALIAGGAGMPSGFRDVERVSRPATSPPALEQVDIATSNLSDQLSELDSELEQLYTLIGPVLKPDEQPASADVGAEVRDRPAISGLAERAERLRWLVDRVQSMRQRAALIRTRIDL